MSSRIPLHSIAKTMAKTATKPTPKPVPAAPARELSRGSGEIRIIGGAWKRTRLSVADKPGLRPTPDRVRETLFNWLGQDLGGWHCVDAFAGTGALGFEAASRGAASVLFLEKDGELAEQIRATAQRLKAAMVKVQRGDAVSALAALPPDSVDLVLLDPPFDAELFEPALRAAAQKIRPDGQIYLEAPKVWTDADLATFGLRQHRHLKAGQVHAHLLRRIA